MRFQIYKYAEILHLEEMKYKNSKNNNGKASDS